MASYIPYNKKLLETPTVQMTVPLFIRVLELVREDVKSDVNLHIILETILAMSTENRDLTMADYPAIALTNPR
jgi:hypothetical protein